MKRISLFLLVVFPLSGAAACSGGDGGSARQDAGGSGNSTSAGSGGTSTGGSGTAGTSTTTAGTSGGGSGGGSGFACAGTSVEEAAITDFESISGTGAMSMWGAAPGLTGGLFVYPEPALSLDASDGSMMVGGEVADYSGFGVWFTSCIDASAYSGLSFDISGDVGPSATIKIGLQTNGDFPVDVLGMKGACTFATEATKYTECVTPIVAKDVPESGGTITVAWSEFAGGKPVATADPSEIVGIEWSFSWAGPSDTAYEADVTVDNLRFLGEDSGGGGAPGAGGNGAEPGAGGEGGA